MNSRITIITNNDWKENLNIRFIKDSKNLKKVGEDWIHASYVSFLNFFKGKKALSEDDFIVSAYFSYGWMPTIPNISGDFKKLAEICSKCIPSNEPKEIKECEMQLLVSAMNNSLVGTSKLLHFINPQKYAIWDSRVYRYLFGETAHDSRLHDIKLYKEYLELLKYISGSPGNGFDHVKNYIKNLVSIKPEEGLSDFRIIELVFFTLGANSIKEIGAPIASKLTTHNNEWPQYKFDKKFIPCVLDATAEWYKESKAKEFFCEWTKELKKNVDYSKPPQWIEDQKRMVESHDYTSRDWVPFDILAWYFPASIEPSKNLGYLCDNQADQTGVYGIHFCVEKMKDTCHRVVGFTLGDTLKNDLWLAYSAFFQMVLAHEYCHAWVEDIVLACELLVMRNPSKNYYKNKLQLTRGYIKNEEALCNTVAYGWLKHFLQTIELDEKIKAEIQKHITKFMKSQPLGYSDFIEIETLPIQNEFFLGLNSESPNIIELVVETYLNCAEEACYVDRIKKIVYEYFDFSIKNNQTNVKPKNLIPGLPDYRAPRLGKMWKAPVPIFFH